MIGRSDLAEHLDLAAAVRSTATAATVTLARAERARELADGAGMAWASRWARIETEILHLTARSLCELAQAVDDALPEAAVGWVVRFLTEDER
jgi:hypothetical protein